MKMKGDNAESTRSAEKLSVHANYNSRVTKASYKTELRIIASKIELLTRTFFEIVTRFDNFRVSKSRFLKTIKFQSY